ncbi:hypothetical protein OGATHE_005496, partial [Ogataea polymorpha]
MGVNVQPVKKESYGSSPALVGIAPKKLDEAVTDDPAEPLSDVPEVNGDGRRKRKRKTRIDPAKLVDEEVDESKIRKRKKKGEDDHTNG